MSQKKKSFEDSLAELEKIVGKLEQGDLALEESLELFEKGVSLSRECQERLNKAERRIEVLLRDRNGEPALEDLGDQRAESVEVETFEIVFEGEEEETEDDIPF